MCRLLVMSQRNIPEEKVFSSRRRCVSSMLWLLEETHLLARLCILAYHTTSQFVPCFDLHECGKTQIFIFFCSIPFFAQQQLAALKTLLQQSQAVCEIKEVCTRK